MKFAWPLLRSIKHSLLEFAAPIEIGADKVSVMNALHIVSAASEMSSISQPEASLLSDATIIGTST